MLQGSNFTVESARIRNDQKRLPSLRQRFCQFQGRNFGLLFIEDVNNIDGGSRRPTVTPLAVTPGRVSEGPATEAVVAENPAAVSPVSRTVGGVAPGMGFGNPAQGPGSGASKPGSVETTDDTDKIPGNVVVPTNVSFQMDDAPEDAPEDEEEEGEATDEVRSDTSESSSEEDDPTDSDYKGRSGKKTRPLVAEWFGEEGVGVPLSSSDDESQVIPRSTIVECAKKIRKLAYQSEEESEYGDIDDGLLLQAETASQAVGNTNDGQEEDLPDAEDTEPDVAMEDDGKVQPENVAEAGQ